MLPLSFQNLMSNKSNRLTRLKFIAVFLLLIVIHNEWLSFVIKTFSWQHLTPDESGEDMVKLLLVADPQILSVYSEPNFPLSYFAVWDANRFVSRAFQMSLRHSNPDIVIFLGDLLNDGSTSTKEEFDVLVSTFKSLFYVTPSVKCVFYIPGDNDIGGEGTDRVTLTKILRFKEAFNSTNDIKCGFVDLYHLNVIPGPGEEGGPTQQVEPLRSSADDANIKLLLSHLPLLPGARKSTMQEIESLKPSLILSAHDHDSYKFVGKKRDPKAEQFWLLRDEQKVWDLDLSSEDLHEISVPTCSYRMGKQIYGYGFASVTKSGRFRYTVLWLPSRFRHLWSYFWALCVCVSLLIFPFILNVGRKCSKKRKSSTSDQKCHNV